jgi:hypothetical protein
VFFVANRKWLDDKRVVDCKFPGIPLNHKLDRDIQCKGRSKCISKVEERSNDMSDPKKTEEIARKIQEFSRLVSTHESTRSRLEHEKNTFLTTHESTLSRLEREKNDKVRSYDQQINRELDEIKQLNKQIDELKRQH